MTIGLSIFLIALGAILRWAVTATVAGISLATAGLILMIAGAIGLIIAIGRMAAGDRTADGTTTERRTVHRDPVA